METITRRLRERRNRPGDQGGFSLIELMIVLLIIAILLAVAIPTYLAARNRAENRAAQESIQHVFVAAKSSYASQNSYSSYPGGATGLAAYLNADGAGAKVLSHSSGTVNKTNEVGEVHGAQYVELGAWAPDGKCWYLLDIESAGSAAITPSGVSGPGVYYGLGPVDSTYGCDPNIGSPPAAGWTTSFAAASAAGTTPTTT